MSRKLSIRMTDDRTGTTAEAEDIDMMTLRLDADRNPIFSMVCIIIEKMWDEISRHDDSKLVDLGIDDDGNHA